MNVAVPLPSYNNDLFRRAVATVEATRGKTPAAGAAFLLDEYHAGSEQLRDAMVLALFAELRLLRLRIGAVRECAGAST